MVSVPTVEVSKGMRHPRVSELEGSAISKTTVRMKNLRLERSQLAKIQAMAKKMNSRKATSRSRTKWLVSTDGAMRSFHS